MNEHTATIHLVRSQLPSGRVAAIDTTQALAMPDVIDVLTPADVAGLALENGSDVLAEDVTYQGQPIAAVIAEDDYAATDAVDALEVRIDGSHQAEPVLGPVDTPDIGRDGAHCIAVVQPRWHIAPLQTNVCEAAPDNDSDAIVVRTPARDSPRFADDLSAAAGLPRDQVRVVLPPEPGRSAIVGDHVTAGHVLTTVAASRLGRQVRWQESRAESLTSGGAQAGFQAFAAFDSDPNGRLSALTLRVVLDVGVRALPPSADLTGLAALPWYGVGDLELETVERRSHLPPAHTDAAQVLGRVLAVEAVLSTLARETGVSRRSVQETFARADGSAALALLEAVGPERHEAPEASTGTATALAPGVAALVAVEFDRGTGEWTPESIVVAAPGDVDAALRRALRSGAIDGYGIAAMQQIQFDDQGTCLAATLMDYVMPSSLESPDVTVVGVEGTGEVAPLAPDLARLSATAAVAAAAGNALSTLASGAPYLALPIRSCDVWDAADSPADRIVEG